MRQVFLTFDVEDFINSRSILALNRLLLIMNKYNFKGIFFITGHMAEKLGKCPEVLKLLANHEIGYHSSAHSVRPTIFEFTDVPSYKEAFLESIKRENAHINPLTGRTEGKGGIMILKELFPQKYINAFRAPGFCWTPPHLEALATMGIKYDFSACLSLEPVKYRGTTFYPRQLQFFGDEFSLRSYKSIFFSLLKKKATILVFHPNIFVNSDHWDNPYHKCNPKKLTLVKPRTLSQIMSRLIKFELVLKLLKLLQNIGFIHIQSQLVEVENNVVLKEEGIRDCFNESMRWAIDFFNYRPKFLLSHYFSYFSVKDKMSKTAERNT